MPARETALREHLRGLDASPLAQLPYETHFARCVILPLDGPRLFFSSHFDVSAKRYLEALAGLEEAAAIWSHCESDGAPATPCAARYLAGHRVQVAVRPSGVAEGHVGEVNEALDRQAALSRFAWRPRRSIRSAWPMPFGSGSCDDARPARPSGQHPAGLPLPPRGLPVRRRRRRRGRAGLLGELSTR